MKMVKSLLLGSAAGLVAIAGAQAADLPVKAKPVQYVKICSLYGVGFYYIPGTDMCLKVGGWARQELGVGYNGSFSNNWLEMNANDRSTHDFHWRVKGVITLDARNATPYGTVRSYVTAGISTNTTSDPSGTLNYGNRWFIQWAGFTFGHATSAFDGWYIGAKYAYGPIYSTDTGDGGWDVVTYTAQLGNGLSASLSAEVRRTHILRNTGIAAGATVALGAVTAATGYGGSEAPDIVGNLRISQAWGSAQVSGAWHLINPGYYTPGVIASGAPGDESGWAVAAGATIKLPMLGPRDEIAFGAVYTSGASDYSNAGPAAGDFLKFDGPGGIGTLGSVAYGLSSDGVYGGSIATGNASGVELTDTWAFGVGLSHWWNPQWQSLVSGLYREVDYSGLGNAMMCFSQGFGAAGSGAGTTAVAAAGCNNDFSYWAVNHTLNWHITSTFYMGLEVVYSELNSASAPAGVAAIASGIASRPTATYRIEDQDQWQFRFRVNRTFYQ